MVHVACSPSLQSHRFSRAFGWSPGPRCCAPKKTLQKYFPASSAEAASSGTSLDWPGGSSCCGRSFSLYSVSWRQGPSPAVSCGQSLTSFLPASRMLPQPPPPRRASGAESCPLGHTAPRLWGKGRLQILPLSGLLQLPAPSGGLGPAWRLGPAEERVPPRALARSYRQDTGWHEICKSSPSWGSLSQVSRKNRMV